MKILNKFWLTIIMMALSSCNKEPIYLSYFGEEESVVVIKEIREACIKSSTVTCDSWPYYEYTAEYYCDSDNVKFSCYKDIKFSSNKKYDLGQKLQINLVEAKR